MARVLLPLDGSPLAEQAIPMAGALARALHAPIDLMAVYPQDQALVELGGINPYPADERSLAGLEAYLNETAQHAALAGLTVERDIRLGQAADQIALATEEKSTAMVVMTTHGAGSATRRPRGRVADELVRTLTVPVAVAPAGGAVSRVARVLIALDGSDDADRALPVARKLADGAGAAVHLVIVCDAEPAFARTREDAEAVAKQLADAAASHLHAVVLPREETAVVSGHPVDGILEYAKEHECDIIAMATHGRTGRARLDLGSVADGVLASADRPVLLVPVRG